MARSGRCLAAVAALTGLALLLARLPLTWAAGGLLAASLGVAILLQPALGLAAIALLLPFGSVFSLPLPGANLSDLLVAVVVLAWLARGIARREVRFRAPRLTWPVLLFTWLIALSLTQAVSWRLGLTEWIKWAEFAVLFLIASQVLYHRQTIWVLVALFAAGTAEAILGAYQFSRQVGPEEFILMGRFMRAYGTFSQPNPYAGYLGSLVPVAASLAIGAFGQWWQRRSRRDLTIGVACGLVASFLIAGIGMSWSRGSWLGVGAALVVVATLRSRRSAPIFAGAMISVVAVFLVFGTSWLPAPIAARLGDLNLNETNVDLGRVEVTEENFAVLERLGHWQAGIAMFNDHPWLGIGIGNYAEAYPAYASPRFYDPLGHAHNIYLNFLAETGVLGTAGFLIFWLASIWLTWDVLRSASPPLAALAVGVLGSLVYVSVHNVFDNLFVAHMQLQLALLLGMLAAQRECIA